MFVVKLRKRGEWEVVDQTSETYSYLLGCGYVLALVGGTKRQESVAWSYKNQNALNKDGKAHIRKGLLASIFFPAMQK